MEKFQKSLCLFFEQYQPQTILYIGKVFGEYYPCLVPCKRPIKWTNLYLREPRLRVQEDKAMPLKNILGTFHMAETLEEALQKISTYPSYDLVLMDTVHLLEYIEAILDALVQHSTAPYLILHDAAPHHEQWTTPSRSSEKVPWCGETYKAVNQFHGRYPGTTRIVRDGHAGYAFVRLWDIKEKKKTPHPRTPVTVTDRIPFSSLFEESEDHEDFFHDALESREWVDAPAPSHFPLRQHVQRIAVARGVSFHVFWKDFTSTEDRRGPSLSLFVRGREKLKFDFQGVHAHYHITDDQGRDSGRLPFSSSTLSLQIQEMKTILDPPVEWEDAFQDACNKIWSM